MRVTRGERFDVAEWTTEGTPPPEREPGAGLGHIKEGSSGPVVFAVVASIAAIVLTVLLVRQSSPGGTSKGLAATAADLSAVHAGVTVAGAEVRKLTRVAVGQTVATDEDGRARLRLDDGTAIVLDRATELSLTDKGITLARGRIFVEGAPGARTEIGLGEATALISGAGGAAAGGRAGADARIYAVDSELTVRAGGVESTVRGGETAAVSGGKAKVAPERGFDDWTGGMAAPWGARGAPRRAVGEIWGRTATAATPTAAAEIGSPLTIRSHDVKARVSREVAETEVRTVFFNAGSDAVLGDFRMAIPPGAIVQRFATIRGESVSEGHLAMAARGSGGLTASGEALEWAGDGWLRGTIPGIAPGATVTVVVGYVEWLTPVATDGGKHAVVQYRYPMASDAAPPLIGEFSASVDASPSSPTSLAAGLGARVSGSTVELRRPDFRPTADLCVDVEIEPWAAPARLYVAPPAGEGDDDGATVLVRTEAPAAAKEEGVTLALVLDTSRSVDPTLLDAERALAEAVVSGLGKKDRLVVLAADQTARPVGPDKVGHVDAERRKATIAALSGLAPGGATDLGRALEAAADALPADAPAAMVVYVGDGWPTVGDANVDLIQARLSRRPGGAPRLGAVAVGPLVNRYALAALVRGSGPLLEIADSADAARAAVSLVAEALQPTIAGVEILFGPEVERIYPRGARAVPAGETVSAVGRVRGEPPKEITLRWRDADGAHEERRALTQERAASEPDVARRWAAARVEEIALTGKGREAAIDVALRAGLLTPWTGWVTSTASAYVPSTLATRILDLSSGSDGFSASFATPRGTFGSLTDVPGEDAGDDGEDAFKTAVAEAASRVLEEAGPAVRACRDSRAALRPEIGGHLEVALTLDGEGRADGIKVKGAGDTDDDPLDRCVKVVIEGLSFPASGLKVKVEVSELLELPPLRATLRGRKCSPTSTLPLPLRRAVWRERLDRGAAWTVYLEAKQSCELATWTDKRTLLELVLTYREDMLAIVDVARHLARAGDDDAAALLRREAVRRARSPEEVRSIKRALFGDERYPFGAFRKQYEAAKDDGGRLGVVRRFLRIAPHDTRLRKRLLSLLEALGMKQELADEVRRVRLEGFADASLLAESAAALRRAGDEAEARRAFGELAERAPADPWARAFLGDRLRNEGWFDDAALAFEALEELVPDDPAAVVRLAVAHAGAGRLDIAQRMLSRVAQTGGRAGDAKLGELAGHLGAALLVEALGRPAIADDDRDRITRSILELPRPAGATIVLVRAPASAQPLELTLVRGPKDAREERAPEIATPGLGLYTLRLDPGDTGGAVLRLRRPEELAPARPTRVRVDALVPGEPGKPPAIVTTEAEVPSTGKPIEIRWAAGAWSAG